MHLSIEINTQSSYLYCIYIAEVKQSLCFDDLI
jgi:hypothetical protein